MSQIEKMIVLYEALEKMGYKLDSITFQEGVALAMDIENVVKGHLFDKIVPTADAIG